MKSILLILSLSICAYNLQAQDTTTILAGKNLLLTQKSTDTLLLSVKRGATSLLSLVAPPGTDRNPYLALGITGGGVTATPPYVSIGGNWQYSGGMNPAKAKLLLFGAGWDSTRYVGMGVSSGRGMEFYKGTTPGFYFNGRVSVAEGGNVQSSTITDSAIVIGNMLSGGRVGNLSIGGTIYTGSGDASQARIKLFPTNTIASIAGFGLSSTGVEYYSGTYKNHVFWGNMVNNGRLFQKDTIYFGPTTLADAIGPNYIFLGRATSGPTSTPAKITLNNSMSDEVNKPTKAKLILYGASDNTILGFGVTATTGLEMFTGAQGQVVIRGGVIKYDVNRVSKFDSRTLVDKAYVDSVKSATMAQWAGLNSDTARISHTGNVGIGIAASSNATDKLRVDGNIRARRVIVDLDNWGDYVFDGNYHLRPLENLNDYIRKYKHLPDMKPAGEIEKEGGDVGELVKQQQVKIEELTLYIIEQNKKQQTLEQQLQEQLKMIQALQNSKK